MAQGAIKSPTYVVDFLVSQHEQIKSMFAQALSASGEAREKAFVELRRLLAVHETAEEEIVHPRAKRKIANGAEVVDERLHEEHEAKTVLQELEKLDRVRDAIVGKG
jgi:hemerythrin superfamily protein